jgi:diguanylate cyclase (GGDEF)-like protein/PAS domain S-box-containing protein
MPVRLRLPLALLACAVATVVVSVALWRLEQGDVRAEADERAHAAASGLEERADAAVLALKGVRAAYDASGSVDAEAFATHARVPLARPEIVAVGWAPRVSAAQRGAVESGEQIRIEAPAGALVTYPLLRQEPAGDSPNVLDLGSDPSLGEALRIARSTGTPQLSAPVRLDRNGGLGTFAFVPVFARDLPLDTPAQRRDALLGVVVGALSANELAEAAFAGLPRGLDVRVTDGPAVLAHGPGGTTVARAAIGGRTWRIALTPTAASPLVPVGAAVTGTAAFFLILGFALRLRRRDQAEFELELELAQERLALAHAAAQADEEQHARRLVADATDALVLELDRDGVILSCSTAVERLLGYSADELVGTAVFSLVHPDDVLSQAGPHRYLHKDGTYLPLEGRRIARRDGMGLESGVVAILHGIASTARTAEQRIQDAVAVEPDPVELFSVVAEEIAHDLGVAAVAIVRFETAGFGTIVGAAEPRGSATLVPGTTITLTGDDAPAAVFATGRPATGAVPVRVGARVWGAIVAEGEAARLAELALAAQPAIAFADASAQLGALATRDHLTNLPDHRAFHEQLRAEARRANRHERALSLVLVNVDGFRRINAEHGRLAGDRVLAEVGRRLAATVRNGELVSRLSADHFGWILPETEGLNGWIAAERARRALAAAPIEGVGVVTASAGVCDFEDVSGADELLAFTEVALAHAKGAGGDVTFRWSRELDARSGDERETTDDRGVGRLRALARELDAEDPGTEGHSERVARLSEKLALSSGWSGDRAIRLAQAALLHDVGKLGVDEDVLRKPGPLSAEELEQIRNHPDTGAELAVNALDEEQLAWIRHHHERWDGAGYPNGAAGEAIPGGARLLALAEAWDAMTSSRVYGEALTLAEAVAECKRERGKQFAPEAVDALERLWALGALDDADVRATTFD